MKYYCNGEKRLCHFGMENPEPKEKKVATGTLERLELMDMNMQDFEQAIDTEIKRLDSLPVETFENTGVYNNIVAFLYIKYDDVTDNSVESEKWHDMILDKIFDLHKVRMKKKPDDLSDVTKQDKQYADDLSKRVDKGYKDWNNILEQYQNDKATANDVRAVAGTLQRRFLSYIMTSELPPRNNTNIVNAKLISNIITFLRSETKFRTEEHIIIRGSYRRKRRENAAMESQERKSNEEDMDDALEQMK